VKQLWNVVIAVVLLGAVSGPGALAQSESVSAVPLEPIAAIVDAFRAHDLVALSDAHGNAQAQAFLRKLVADPRFADAVNDIVFESGNSRYQDLVDRFVGGDDAPAASLRQVWQNTTIANEIPVDAGFFEAVRAVNASRPSARRLRVLLGDPPIDWTTVRTRADHLTWLAMRDSFPAALIQTEVLAKRRKALVLYGQLHFQRKNVMSNLEMDDWRMQTIVSLIERSTPSKFLTIWQFDDGLAAMQPDIASWPAPSFAAVRGTRLGAADITMVSLARARMQVKGDALVPVPKEQWLPLRIEDQLDAVLYLGPSSAMTEAAPSNASCAEPGYLEERLRRIALTGIPAFEAERARKLCAGVVPRQ
jgi:hypothetical protein